MIYTISTEKESKELLHTSKNPNRTRFLHILHAIQSPQDLKALPGIKIKKLRKATESYEISHPDFNLYFSFYEGTITDLRRSYEI
ncbi:MAG: hypothetical protein CL678_10460 [Bdellovibrionaceae bacterium]|nr:hypothetical protein [Pseudobdellovibrionaceae bacterium]|tara:strand:- start:377 stop:631 length:255 start_codon:yes stop_codon:yes gene_type:complete